MQTALEEVASLCLFSYVGYGIRFATERFTSGTTVLADNSPIYMDFYANIIGCIWMGMIISLRASFEAHHLPVYLGLSTGLAGSLTTFSGWNGSASLAVWQSRISAHVFLLQLLISLCTSIVSYQFGVHLIRLYHFAMSYCGAVSSSRAGDAAAVPPEIEQKPEDHASTCVHHVLLYAFLAITFTLLTAVWLVLFFTVPRWRGLWFAFLLAPFGTLLRFYLARHNAKFFPRFPLFTFFVNVVGTLLFDGLMLIWDKKTHLSAIAFDRKGTDAVLWLIPGFVSGFCGCLTTVSTFVSELQQLPTHYAYVYAFASVGVTQVLLCVINGPYFKH